MTCSKFMNNEEKDLFLLLLFNLFECMVPFLCMHVALAALSHVDSFLFNLFPAAMCFSMLYLFRIIWKVYHHPSMSI